MRQASESLKHCGLKEDEWTSLNQIASMSDQLVLLEQEAIAEETAAVSTEQKSQVETMVELMDRFEI